MALHDQFEIRRILAENGRGLVDDACSLHRAPDGTDCTGHGGDQRAFTGAARCDRERQGTGTLAGAGQSRDHRPQYRNGGIKTCDAGRSGAGGNSRGRRPRSSQARHAGRPGVDLVVYNRNFDRRDRSLGVCRRAVRVSNHLDRRRDRGSDRRAGRPGLLLGSGVCVLLEICGLPAGAARPDRPDYTSRRSRLPIWPRCAEPTASTGAVFCSAATWPQTPTPEARFLCAIFARP